jgi:hypothetical protein
MHSWGEENVDWEGISDAAYYIGGWLRKWGRMSVSDMKEKYGTVRVYTSFGWYSAHQLTHPGYAYHQWPKWLRPLDYYVLSRVISVLNPVVVPIHKAMYRYRYKQALRRWPHLAGEILMGADWTELLLGLDSRLVVETTGAYTSIRWDDPERPAPAEEDLP